MDKIEAIKLITDYHPGSRAGIDRGWSYYVGGMMDSGDWYYRKLLDIPLRELLECLEQLKEDYKPVPPKVYTEEEKRQHDTIIKTQNGGWIREIDKKAVESFMKDLEKRNDSIWNDEK